MPLHFQPFTLPDDREALADFLSTEEWPFHVNARISREKALAMIDQGSFSSDDQETLWIIENEARVGILRAQDLDDVDDGAPVFDLRIAARHRGRGIGREAVQWLTRHLFTRFPQLNRIAATTRVDNDAMRAALRASGYVKEGHFRESWPGADGHWHDTVFYATLRRDWQSGATTAVRWRDEEQTG